MNDDALAKAATTTPTAVQDALTTPGAVKDAPKTRAEVGDKSPPPKEIQDTPISGAGWIFLTLAWTAILVTCIFCFVRLFTTRKKPSAPLEIDAEGE